MPDEYSEPGYLDDIRGGGVIGDGRGLYDFGPVCKQVSVARAYGVLPKLACEPNRRVSGLDGLKGLGGGDDA